MRDCVATDFIFGENGWGRESAVVYHTHSKKIINYRQRDPYIIYIYIRYVMYIALYKVKVKVDITVPN